MTPARRTRPRQPPRPATMTSTPMYDALSTTELTALQEALYTATERAYWVVSLAPENQGWLARYRPVHTETGRLFLEAGEELRDRLGNEQDRRPLARPSGPGQVRRPPPAKRPAGGVG